MMRWLRRILGLEELKPGKCQCGHLRCSHKDGKRQCVVETQTWKCACQIYIPEHSVEEKELDQLRKMAGIKS